MATTPEQTTPVLPDEDWYRGSPAPLRLLWKGSTVTRDRDLAAAFSHRPTVVSIEDDGSVRHNGKMAGFVHHMAAPIGPSDVQPHPCSSLQPGLEYLTLRDLPVTVIERVPLTPADQLSDQEVVRLRERITGSLPPRRRRR